MKIMLEMHDSINQLNDNEVLVYDKKTKTLKAFNVEEFIQDNEGE